MLFRLQIACQLEEGIFDMTFESLRQTLMEVVNRLSLTGETVAIRPGAESKVILYLFLYLTSLVDGGIRESLEKRKVEIEASLNAVDVKAENLKSIVKTTLF